VPILEILPGLSFIQRGWMNANSILGHTGSRTTLVDSGHMLGLSETLALLRQAGADPTRIDQIINTHTHSDHIGGNAALLALGTGRTQVATSALSAQWLRAGNHLLTWLDYAGQEATFFPVNQILNPGERIEIGPYGFEVLAAPGHAADSLVLYCRSKRLLISADAVWENDCGVINVLLHGWQVLDAAIETVERLRTLDVVWVLPGHGAPISDPAPNFARVQRRLRSFQVEPQRLADHLLRRFWLFTLMMHQPIIATALYTEIERLPVFQDYTRMYFNDDFRSLFSRILNDFRQRRLVDEQGGWLRATGPR